MRRNLGAMDAMLAQNIAALISLWPAFIAPMIGFRGVPVGTQKPYEWQQWHAEWARC